MVSVGSWQRLDGTESSSVAPSRTPGFHPGIGPHDLASSDGQAAPSTGNPTTARNWCLGQGNCPWCLLQCTADEHGNLLAAGRRVIEAKQQSLAIMGTTRQQIAATTGQCWMMSLFACAQQVQQENPGPDTERVVARLRLQGLGIPTGVAAQSSGEPAAVDSVAASSSGSKEQDKDTKMSWSDPLDATWRLGSKVERDDEQARRIKVYLGPKQGFVDLPEDTTKELLPWYDTAAIGDVKKGVSCQIDGKQFFLNYTFEGWHFLTQQNPRRTDGKRQCLVYLAEGLVRPDAHPRW